MAIVTAAVASTDAAAAVNGPDNAWANADADAGAASSAYDSVAVLAGTPTRERSRSKLTHR